MTVTTTLPPGAGGGRPAGGPRLADDRRHRDLRAQGDAGHPRRRTARHRDPALLRPPAARPGRRLPPVHRRGRGPAQADGLLHHHLHRRHGRQVAAHLAGRREGPARGDGAAADQPPAGLPGLRQGRRVPAAEPGDAGRRPRPASRARSATFEKPVPISTQVLLDRERCVLCARCTRFSNQIAGDPMIELMERGALQQVGTGRGRPLRVVLLRQHHPDLPGRRADLGRVPLPLPPLRPGLLAERVRALRGRLRDPHRPPARQGHAAAGGGRPRGQRGVDLRQGALRLPLRAAAATGSPPRWCATPSGELEPASWPEALEAAARGLRARRAAGPGVLTGGRLTVEDAYAYAKFARVALDTNDVDFRARVHSSRGGRLPGRPRRRPRPRPGRHGRHVHRRWRRRRPCCWPGSSPRRRRPASSCGCARRTASTGSAPSRWPRTPPAGWRRPAARCCRRARHRDRMAGRAGRRRRPGRRRRRRRPRRCAPTAR